jgi:hypothetical protein
MWWTQQSRDKSAKEAAEAQARSENASFIRYCDQIQQAATASEVSIKRSTNSSVVDQNARLAAERAASTAKERAWDDEMNSHEINCALENPMLAEDPRQAVSSMSAGRVRKDHWKGMTSTEKRAILEQQFQQVEEKKRIRREELEREANWARLAFQTDKIITEQQRLADDFRKHQEADRLAFLKQQAQEKQERDARLRETYENKVAPEYFSQFGTSHR